MTRASDSASGESTPTKGLRRLNSRLPQLLDRAATVFAERGFAGASIREIVGPIGMLPGSLYSHFPTKDGRWVCALHTESLKGDPYGRDRRPAAH